MKITPQSSLAILIAAAFSFTSANAAAPDKVLAALELPNNPSILADFQTIFTGTNAVQTEEKAATAAASVRKFEMKHVGGNRLLARVEFDQVPPVEESTRYLIYLDTDNNPETGRPDANAKGIDLMATIVGVRQNLGAALYNKELTPKNTATRAVFDGKTLYVTLEAPLPTTGESIPLVGWVLAQRFTPPQGSNSPVQAHFSVSRGKLDVAPLTQGKEATVL